MENASLLAISPIDGRYSRLTKPLVSYFSEASIIKYRVFVEIEYFISLCELPLPQLSELNADDFGKLREIYKQFSPEDAMQVKEFEKVTNHDVKAVEYFIKKKFEELGVDKFREFVHFGLTSQDINNTAFPYAVMRCHQEVVQPLYELVIAKLNQYATDWKDIPMLAHTHGQPASPTRLGKEMQVFTERLNNQMAMLPELPFSGKFGGAIGNFNAHHVAYPLIDWKLFGNDFLKEKLGLVRQQTTTQIEHYDYLAAYFDNLKRINTILIDLCRDLWTYVSMDYFKQKIKEGEVGSSAMPHKVNPIDFENAEGNLGIANALFEYLSAKLPISRLQRDLTDSTVTRNIGVPLAHTLIALNSVSKGLDKLIVNEPKIHFDLDNNWAVLAEAIQTILRREAYPEPYEMLKKLTRNNEKITESSISQFIDGLNVPESVKMELKAITPFNYTGI